jgi:hypothetical protein
VSVTTRGFLTTALTINRRMEYEEMALRAMRAMKTAWKTLLMWRKLVYPNIGSPALHAIETRELQTGSPDITHRRTLNAMTILIAKQMRPIILTELISAPLSISTTWCRYPAGSFQMDFIS